MGHIKEPDGVDFVINGKPLTDKEKKAISEFIKADKEKIAKQKARKTSIATQTKKVIA
jgi:anaerobic ribonucleoside-triphosphate reductase